VKAGHGYAEQDVEKWPERDPNASAIVTPCVEICFRGIDNAGLICYLRILKECIDRTRCNYNFCR
jgi:hypothetical protein